MNYKFNANHQFFRMIFTVFVILLLITSALCAYQGGGRRSLGFFDVWMRPRVWISAIFCLFGLGLLMKSWVTQKVRLLSLVVISFSFGILFVLPLGSFAQGMSIHPSPLCVIEKPFLFLNAGRGVPVLFLAIAASAALFTLIGNKLFCGWACPLGALQEIAHWIPLSKKWKIKLPFRITNSIRIGLFLLFIVLTFTVGKSIYPYINPFEFFHWGFGLLTIIIFAVTLIIALFIFRPFCYLVCPLGLYTWVIEHISLIRVKMDKNKCTNCNICIEKSPCPAVSSILEGKKSRPDCHACGRCIEVCPENALRFR